ncbi:MAG: hypothetical protein WA989_13285 [Henriciella sp.]
MARLFSKAWFRWTLALSIAVLIVILVAGNGLSGNGMAGAMR